MSKPENSSWWISGEAIKCYFFLTCFAATLGYFSTFTFLEPPKYVFENVGDEYNWIAPEDHYGIAYYRKEFYSAAPIERATLRLTCADFTQAYMNTAELPVTGVYSEFTHQIIDITRLVVLGKNVVAIRNAKNYIHQTPSISVEISLLYADGSLETLKSDSSWRYQLTASGKPVGAKWMARSLDDTDWLTPVESQIPTGYNVPKTEYPYQIHHLRSPNTVIVAPTVANKGGIYTSSFRKSGDSRQWLLLYSEQPYKLSAGGRFQSDTVIDGNQYILHELRATASDGEIPIAIHLYGETEEGTLIAKLYETTGTSVSRNDFEELPLSPWLWQSELNPNPIQALSSWQEINPVDSLPLKPGILASSKLPGTKLEKAVGRVAAFSAAFAVTLVAWWVTSIYARSRNLNWKASLKVDAMAHCIPAVFLLLLILLQTDKRFNPEAFFTLKVIITSLLLLVGFKLFAFIEYNHFRPEPKKDRGILKKLSSLPYEWLVVAILVLTAGYLRANDMLLMSLDHDEMDLIDVAYNIPYKGYPFVDFENITRNQTTYELVTYFIALSGAVFGWNDFSMHLPALLFSLGIIPVIYLLGARTVGRGAGLIAAVIHTFLPLSMLYGHFQFWQSQGTFFTLLTALLFYEGVIRPDKPRAVFVILSAFSFIATYLSWEGSGFIFLILVCTTILIKGFSGTWMWNRPLWYASYLMTAVVLLQLAYRKILFSPYMIVGQGLSDVTSPQLTFLNQTWWPGFYVSKMLFEDFHVILSLIFILFAFFCFKHKGLRYLMTYAILGFISYFGLLEIYGARYMWPTYTIMVVSVAGILMYAKDNLFTLEDNNHERSLLLGNSSFIAVLALVVFSSNSYLIYRNNPNQDTGRADYRSAANYINEHYLPGDTIIAGAGNVIRWYTGQTPEFNLNTSAANKLLFDPYAEPEIYIDRWGGSEMIQNNNQLDEVFEVSDRIWVVIAPSVSFKSKNPYSYDLVNKRGTPIFESNQVEVYLVENQTSITNSKQRVIDNQDLLDI